MELTLLTNTAWFAMTVSPATGDPVMIIAGVVGVSAAAMIVLSILSRRGKGGRK